MADPFLSEIRLFAFNFAPRGWAQCNGQLLPINQNQALFALLGTIYGGDGRVSFGLPSLQGRVPIHTGNGHVLGERAGAAAHTLTVNELPVHTHVVQASPNPGTQNIPADTHMLGQRAAEVYRPPSDLAPMIAGSAGGSGGSQAHENRQPYLAVNFCIALQGIFPSRN